MGILILLFISLISCPSRLAADSQLIDRVAAVVDEDAITQSELDVYLRPIYEQMKQEYKGEQLMRQLQDVRRKLLSQMIEDRLVYHAAKQRGIEATDSDIENQMVEFKKRFSNETALEDALQQEGLTLSSLKDRLKRGVMVHRLHEMEVRSKVVVSPLELQNYYQEHLSEFVEPEQVKARFMTLKKNAQSREKGLKDEEAFTKLKELRRPVLSAEDFTAVAKENSEDSQAAQGGLNAWIVKGSMIPALDEALFKLKLGEVSDIIETPMGYHFFRLEEKKQGKHRNFEEARDDIFQQLYHEKAKERFNSWMEELKRNAYISVR